MTEPSATEPTAPKDPIAVSGDAVDAVQLALAAEHAAVWCYGLVTPFVSGAELDGGSTAHRASRDLAARALQSSGVTPVSAEPAYRTAKPVTDESSATAVLITAEDDVARAWRGVLERTDDRGLRELAVDQLVAAAVRATAWRQSAGEVPAARAMPGTSD